MRLVLCAVVQLRAPSRKAGPRLSCVTSAAPASRYTREPLMSVATSRNGLRLASITLSAPDIMPALLLLLLAALYDKHSTPALLTAHKQW